MDLVTISNRALSVIGTRSSIASMTEASPEAQACTLHFEASCRAIKACTLVVCKGNSPGGADCRSSRDC